jgi:hypothetical protein
MIWLRSFALEPEVSLPTAGDEPDLSRIVYLLDLKKRETLARKRRRRREGDRRS